MMKCHCY